MPAYSSHVTGAITITPPLTWAEIKGTKFTGPDLPEWPDAMLRIKTTTEDTEHGELVFHTADAIVPGTDEKAGFYDLEQNLADIVAEFGAGHEFTGYLERTGEESDDVERYYIRDNAVTRARPEIVWPDEALAGSGGLHAAVETGIREFGWAMYGLDVDSQNQHAEWVGDLASEIVSAIDAKGQTP